MLSKPERCPLRFPDAGQSRDSRRVLTYNQHLIDSCLVGLLPLLVPFHRRVLTKGSRVGDIWAINEILTPLSIFTGIDTRIRHCKFQGTCNHLEKHGPSSKHHRSTINIFLGQPPMDEWCIILLETCGMFGEHSDFDL